MYHPKSSRRALLRAGLSAGLSPALSASSEMRPSSTLSLGLSDGVVSVDAFLSASQIAQVRAGRLVDCTDAFTRAQKVAKVIHVPPGRYGLNGLRLGNGISLLGVGENVVRIDQIEPGSPAIHCVSDGVSGQLSSINVRGMTLHGHDRARVAVLLVAAYKQFAVWRSHFQFVAHNTYRALEIQGADAANVFHCSFDVTSEGTENIAVLVNGGTYNTYRLFLTKCHSWAVDDSSANSEIRAITENCMLFRGQNNRIWATIEEVPFGSASNVGLEDRGFGNTFESPTIIMSSDSKLFFAFKPFSNSIFVNPQIIGKPQAVVHPFALGIAEPFTVIGGRSQAKNTFEVIYNGDSDRQNPELATFVGGSTGLHR